MMIKDKLTDLCGNLLSQNDVANTFCETKLFTMNPFYTCHCVSLAATITAFENATLPPAFCPVLCQGRNETFLYRSSIIHKGRAVSSTTLFGTRNPLYDSCGARRQLYNTFIRLMTLVRTPHPLDNTCWTKWQLYTAKWWTCARILSSL